MKDIVYLDFILGIMAGFFACMIVWPFIFIWTLL